MSAGGLPGPDTDADDLCDPSPATWNTTTWSALNFAPEAPHGFVYETETSGVGLDAVFTVSAYGDLDCDGVQSTFRRTITVAEAQVGWDTDTPEAASLQAGGVAHLPDDGEEAEEHRVPPHGGCPKGCCPGKGLPLAALVSG